MSKYHAKIFGSLLFRVAAIFRSSYTRQIAQMYEQQILLIYGSSE